MEYKWQKSLLVLTTFCWLPVLLASPGGQRYSILVSACRAGYLLFWGVSCPFKRSLPHVAPTTLTMPWSNRFIVLSPEFVFLFVCLVLYFCCYRDGEVVLLEVVRLPVSKGNWPVSLFWDQKPLGEAG